MNTRQERDAQNCEECWFFKAGAAGAADTGVGTCQRYAPRPIAEAYHGSLGGINADWDWPNWPRVEAGDWCGEFVRMEEGTRGEPGSARPTCRRCGKTIDGTDMRKCPRCYLMDEFDS